MPKIDARTLAEHRDLQSARLLGAALDFIVDNDVASLTLAELAKRTGRSRASLYAYFGSADDLRATVCEEALGRWAADMVEEVRRAVTPDERLDRFVTAQIDRPHGTTIDGVLAYVAAQQGEPFRARMLAATELLTAELLTIIEQLGVEPPTRAATIVQGAVAAAYDQVRAGAAPAAVAEDAVAFVRAGLAALRQTGRTSDPTDGSTRGALPVTGGVRSGHAPASRLASQAALSAAVAPSMPVILAAALTEVGGTTQAPPRRTFRPVARIAAAASALTAIGFVSGITGVGGYALHLLLGIALVGTLAWSVRAVASARPASQGLRMLLALAAVTSGVALVAGPLDLDTAIAHVALAALLLAASAAATVTAVRGGRTVSVPPQPL